MIFTETDKKVMDIILKFKPIYEIIYKKTLKYKFNISAENIQLKDMNIQTENLETKQIEKHMGMIIGLLKDNTFKWVHSDLNRDHFKKNIEQMIKTYSLPKDVVNLLNKLCSADIIEFDEKYNEIILLVYSLIYDSSKRNMIRFDDTKDKNFFSYFLIQVPVSLPKEINMYIDDIITELENFDKKNITTKLSRTITIPKIKKSNKRIHKMKRTISNELKEL